MKKNQQILVLNTFAIIMVCIGHSFTAVESVKKKKKAKKKNGSYLITKPTNKNDKQ